MRSKGARHSTVSKIEAALKELLRENPGDFRLNLSELERRSGVSRASLYSESVKIVINNILKEHSVISNNNSRRELLKENKRLKEENKELENQNRVLLIQYAELFSRIYGSSVSGSLLSPDTAASAAAER